MALKLEAKHQQSYYTNETTLIAETKKWARNVGDENQGAEWKNRLRLNMKKATWQKVQQLTLQLTIKRLK